MRLLTAFLIALTVVQAGATLCPGQTPNSAQKALTNSDVIEMTQAGLPESTIILAIQKGPTAFDTSAQKLIQLKQEGVSAKVLDAMLKAGSPTSGTSNGSGVREPETIGFFYFLEGNGSMKQLERLTGQARSAPGKGLVFQVTGTRSSVRLADDHKQDFLIRLAHGTNPNKIALMRFYESENKRAVSVVLSGGFALPAEAKTPTSPGKLPVSITKFGASYKIAPAQSLSPGEYCFSTPDETSDEVFCFGIGGNSTAQVASAGDNTESEVIDGVVLVDGARRTGMKYSTSKMSSDGGLTGFKVKAVLDGNHASLRILNTSPVFLLGIPDNMNPSDYVALVKLDSKSDRREIQISKASTGLMSVKSKSGFPKDSMISIIIEEVTGRTTAAGQKLYRVKVVYPIPAREYALAILGYQFFDFGIDNSQ